MRVMPGLRLMSHAIPRVAGKVFGRKPLLLGRVFDHWEELVGPDFVTRCQPLKLKYRKKGGVLDCTLIVAIASADAPTITLQKGLILERIRSVLGSSGITDLQFEHVLQPKTAAEYSKPKLLTEEKKNLLSHMLEEVDDEDISTRLKTFGESLLKKR